MADRARTGGHQDGLSAGQPPGPQRAEGHGPDRRHHAGGTGAKRFRHGDVVSRNKSLMAELAYSAAALPPASQDVTEAQDKHPVYRFWRGHISGLIAAQRPDTGRR
jgi:hypothetical protein